MWRDWHNLFRDPVRIFGVVSLVFLVSLGIAPAKDHFTEWRRYQHEYLRLIRGRADAATLERRMEHGIQQIWLPEAGVVDRCPTCHLGLKENSLGDVQRQPFRPHPPIPHSLTEYGCVACHRGQGRATNVHEAHRSSLAWEEPILPAKYIEGSCGQCHLSPLPGTPKLNLGRQLLSQEGCVRCHTLKWPDGTTMQASDDPPSLKHIDEKTTREWLYAWIKDPKSYSSTATMPNFQFTDDQARDISAFLIAQSTHSADVPSTVSGPLPGKTQAGAGPTLYGQFFCASCHAMQNAAGNLVGGDFGPELTKIGTKAKPQWLQAWLRNPGDYDSSRRMPHYRLTDQQVAILVDYLQTKKDDDFLANVHLPDPTSEQVAHGRALVNESGCASCHEINGIKKPENFAPELTHVGSKPFAQLAFPANVQHSLHDYIAAKVRSPRAFGPTLKMPQFKFSEQQIDAITTALLAQTDRALAQQPSMRTAALHESNYDPAGKAGKLIDDLRCFSCHRINGRGGDMAPDLSWEGSAVQRKWLADFLRNPETLRPALIRRMPKFNLTDSEIDILADYIVTVYQTPALDRDASPVNATPTLMETGRQLFYAKYSCQSCHIVDPQKDKGYIGPALWSVGARLNGSWIYAWLKNPQALRPGSMEPNQHMSDEDAQALTAFLSSLKSAPRSATAAAKGAQQ